MSTTTGVESRVHPIARFSAGLHRGLDVLAGSPAWSMTPDEQRAALVELARAEARITELRLRVLAAADRADVGAESAATSTAAWVAHRTRQVRSAAYADLRLAGHLDAEFVATREALAAGRVDVAQARVVVQAVTRLPDSVGAHDRERAQTHLLQLAREPDARARGDRPGRRRPGGGSEARGGGARSHRVTYLHLTDDGDGTHTGRFRISTLHAAMLTKMLHALALPRRRDTGPDRSRLTRPELMGAAFCRLLERYPTSRLPRAGGVSATVVVLLDYDRLLSGLGAAHLDTGESISAARARLLACEAGVIPAVYRHVLGGRSVVLDQGRRRRFHDESERIALTVRDRGCSTEGCDRPAGWCHAHHDEVAWAEGGGTSVERGRLLCPFHHGKAHSPAFVMTRLSHGKVRFHRRT